MCFVFFQEKSLGFDRKKDFNNDFKEDQRFEEAPSIKESKVEENSSRHGRTTGPRSRTTEAETTHGRKVGTLGHAVAVLGCMATCTPTHSRASWRTVSRASWHGHVGVNPCAVL